jgi:putative transposase
MVVIYLLFGYTLFMATTRWKTSKTAVYNLGYHVIFCPKYRRPVLVGEIETRLQALLFEKARDLKIDIEELEIMPEHVHLFIKASPSLAPHFIIGQLKGYSSHILRKEFPELKSRLPSLWTRSYYVESVGHISEETVKQYIEDQKGQ